MTRPLRLTAQAAALAVVGALLALLVWKVAHGSGSSVAARLRQGGTPVAPRFTLPRLDRPGTLSLASLRGKGVVVNFWASWCIPCKREAPRLQAAWERWRGKGLVVVGVDAQDFAGDARRFMRRYRLTYPVVHDGPGRTLDSFGVTGFPETYFIRRDGRVVGEHVEGEVTERDLSANIPLTLR